MILMREACLKRQIVYNRFLEKIGAYEYEKEQPYIDPSARLDNSLVNEANAERFIPFFEILIFQGLGGDFSYRMTLDCEDYPDPKEWNDIRDRVRDELVAFEKEKFGIEGKLFYPVRKDQAEIEKKGNARQKEYERRYWLAQAIKKRYQNLNKNILKILKTGASNEAFAEKFKLSVAVIKETLYSTSTGKPTPSQLALKVLEKTKAAKKLKIQNGQRLYDEIISRGEFAEFPKLKKHGKSKRLKIAPIIKGGNWMEVACTKITKPTNRLRRIRIRRCTPRQIATPDPQRLLAKFLEPLLP